MKLTGSYPDSMESARKITQLVRAAMLSAIVLYGVILKMLPAHPESPPNPVIFNAIAVLAFVEIVVMLILRRIFVARASEVLRSQPEDTAALIRWRKGHLITYAFAEAIALYGIVLHFLGFPNVQASLYLLVGFFLILMSPPNRPS